MCVRVCVSLCVGESGLHSTTLCSGVCIKLQRSHRPKNSGEFGRSDTVSQWEIGMEIPSYTYVHMYVGTVCDLVRIPPAKRDTSEIC